MSKTIIKVENLGKKYSIGDKQKFYTLRDSITNIFDFKKQKETKDEFWALKDINFEVKQGESVGIIGRNGAGKSTLLKILSQITPPTTGKITLHGRVASLLEVGTGFHQELTGRENIFLNGAILGMSRAEIKRKFDEIVAFSEVEKFLDMPVKHYSSGMYMRLAFAVAAHLESEILIVDEVLAVGDAQFQKKCLGKMDDVAKKEGRTVLFVSHNMGAIQVLCKNAVYLKSGKMITVGKTSKIVNKYLLDTTNDSNTNVFKPIFLANDFKLMDVSIKPNPFYSGSKLNFKIDIFAKVKKSIDSVVLIITSIMNVRVAIIDLRGEKPWIVVNQNLIIEGEICDINLVEGTYQLSIYVKYDGGIEIELPCYVSLNVTPVKKQLKIVPYPPAARGLIELSSQFNSFIS